MNLVPIDTGVKTLQMKQTSDTSAAAVSETSGSPSAAAAVVAPREVTLSLGAELAEMKAGQKTKIPVMIKASGPFRSAVLGLRFDDKKLAVRSVSFGDVFGGGLSETAVTPFLNQGGRMFVSLNSAENYQVATEGILAFVEVEALVDGKPQIDLVRDALNFIAADGRNFAVKF